MRVFSDNRMYLRMSSNPGLWIDGDLYNQFSMTGKCSTPSELYIGWVDSHNNESSLLVDTLTSTWEKYGPIDLSGNWDGTAIKLIWLRLDPVSEISPEVEARIGQVFLKERP